MLNSAAPSAATANSADPLTRSIEANAFYSPSETALILGVAVRTLEDWRLDGKGPPYTRLSARAVKYLGKSILEFAERRTFRSTSEEAVHAA